MRLSTDTTLRYLKLLTELPVFPQRISTGALRARLAQHNLDYRISVRTMQRDLDKLSAVFPIGCMEFGRGKYWFWTDRNALTQLPAMGEQTALTLRLAEVYLSALLPPSSLALLRPYFKHARQILKGTRLQSWTQKVRIIPDSLALLPPTINRRVQQRIYEALLHNRQLSIIYQRRGETSARELLLNPLGLVLRRHLIYLIATAWDYSDPLHFALHRIRSAKVMDTALKKLPGFHLDKHVKMDKAFSYPVSQGSLKLKLLVNEAVAEHLLECRLAADQKIKTQTDGRTLITATVADTNELRWWLQGMGAGVEVVGPKLLRAAMRVYAENMMKLYGKLYD